MRKSTCTLINCRTYLGIGNGTRYQVRCTRTVGTTIRSHRRAIRNVHFSIPKLFLVPKIPKEESTKYMEPLGTLSNPSTELQQSFVLNPTIHLLSSFGILLSTIVRSEQMVSRGQGHLSHKCCQACFSYQVHWFPFESWSTSTRTQMSFRK